MAFQIKDPETLELAKEMSERNNITVSEAVKLALQNEKSCLDNDNIPLRERLEPLLAKMAAIPSSGLLADKAFYDEF
jgi:antitoxin VapB